MEKKEKANRLYRSRLFEMVFRDKMYLLELYNAVYISFLIDSRLTLYEHQSTYSPNLPLRYLLYVADLYSSITRNANLYGTKIVRKEFLRISLQKTERRRKV